MAYSHGFIQDLKSRIDALDLIGSYVELKETGNRFRGLCPFHQEKTASFFVSPDTGLYHCFGCHAAGDVIRFVEQIEGLDFNQAVRFLAERYNIPIQTEDGDVEDRSDRDAILKALRIADTFFRECLAASPEIMDYLNRRGLTADTIMALGIGYAPRSGLLDSLRKNGISREIAASAGLLNDEGMEKFRERVMFPIRDLYGHTIAFGGRIVRTDTRAPKYLNSPATAVFEKKRMLYGLDLTRDFIRRFGSVILVEGYMDFAALYQHGVVNVAAALGTSFTEQHAILLKRFTKKVYLCFDADDAGLAAAIRSFTILAPGGLFVYAVPLPSGEDPDSFIRTRGKDAFMEQVDRSREIPVFLAEQQLSPSDMAALPLEERLDRVGVILDAIAVIPDRIRQSYYLKDLAGRLNMPERVLAGQLHQRHRPRGTTAPGRLQSAASSQLDSLKEAEKSLLLMVAGNPGLKQRVREEMDWLKALPVAVYLEEIVGIDYHRIGDVLHMVSDPLREFLAVRSEPVSAGVDQVLNRLKKQYLKMRIEEIRTRLETLQEGLTDEQKNRLLRERERLAREFHRL